jgi:type II secretory pathway pseudopilin PulG
MTKSARGRLAAVRHRATDSRGLALSELIVVMAILLVVLTALTQLFVSASTAEIDMSKRVQAQQDARLALDKLRREIHCAKEVSWTPPFPTASIRIKLGAYCPTNTTGAETTVTWCTAGAAAPFTLWRYSSTTCSGTGRKWADYLTTDAVFTNYTPSGGGLLGTLRVDLPVDLTPADGKQRYRLEDDIVLRNTPRT